MIRITKRTPPVFEFEIKSDQGTKIITVHADWFDGSDYAQDQLETSLHRYHEARDLNYWLGWFSYRLLSLSELTELDEIVGNLSSTQGAIVRFLWERPRGVSFSEFCDCRRNGSKLTESTDPNSIDSMLRRIAAKLSKHGWKIYVSIRRDIIRIERRKKKSEV